MTSQAENLRKPDLEPQPKRVGLVTPGQALQPSVLIENYNILMRANPGFVSQLFAEARQAVKEIYQTEKPPFDLEEMLQNPDSEAWKKTSAIQPATFTLSSATFLMTMITLREKGFIFHRAIGHSVGQHSAAYMTEAYGKDPIGAFAKGVRITTFRGMVMQQAYDLRQTTLVGLLGADEETAARIASKVPETYEAIFNAPGLISVAIPLEYLDDLDTVAKEAKVRTRRYNTIGGFHSPHEDSAREKFDVYMKVVELNDPLIPMIANSDGKLIETAEELKADLVEGIAGPLRWDKASQTLAKDVDALVEVGPGDTMGALNQLNKTELVTFSAASTLAA